MRNSFSYFTRPLRTRARRHFDLGGANLIEHKKIPVIPRQAIEGEPIFPNRCSAFLNFEFIAAREYLEFYDTKNRGIPWAATSTHKSRYYLPPWF